jgi:hypothetical protein
MSGPASNSTTSSSSASASTEALELRLPVRQHAIHEAARPLRAEDALPARAALVPGRNDELEEIDDVVGVEMREEDGVDVAPGRPRAEETLCHARAAVDEKGLVFVAQKIRRTVALRRALRAPGAEKRHLHASSARMA